jgi:hypothetical protein
MIGRASNGQVKELVLGVAAGVPANISAEDAKRNLADMSQIHLWLQLGLTTDLSLVDVAAVKSVLQNKILELVTTIKLPAFGGEFAPRDYFRVTLDEYREVERVVIGHVDADVKLLMEGRLEPDAGKVTIRIHRLCRPSEAGTILATLGKDVKLGFCQMYRMMEKQGRGQEGYLLVDGRPNIFYIEGTDWMATCCWDSGFHYWRVYANPVADPRPWRAGSQIISR